uniref:Uncharacterized protein n=1 Tax=Octopus bimaculoides TaxID=37653 RepID=A0A0L8HTU9_OCTBM
MPCVCERLCLAPQMLFTWTLVMIPATCHVCISYHEKLELSTNFYSNNKV